MLNLAKFILSVMLLTLNACGPISAHSAIAKAEIMLETAKGVQAERLAVYEYTRAKMTLKKAKEEEGYSSFQNAVDLATESQRFSDEARERSLRARRVKPRTPAELMRQRRGVKTSPSTLK